ncbi:MAG: D-2-hydroxyacid dehydrogenase [Candidatus Latescibacterota bacterium]|nr:D-2-hydroxyacid dehydrogenase [Candidatus Latescibacterota bacterium]
MKIVLNPSVEDELFQKVKRTAPDAEVVMVDRDAAATACQDAEIIFGNYSVEILKSAKNLKWIQTTSAGMDANRIPAELKESNIMVCNASGVHAIQVAEHGFALMMALMRGINESFHNQQKKIWGRTTLTDIYGATVVIVGFGGIGRKFAEQAAAFQARIIALDVQGTNKPDCVEAIWGMDRFDEAVKLADVVFLACPHTDDTDKLINAHCLDIMKPTAYVVNTARGRIVDEQAMIEGLMANKIAGAGLDVTEVEPLSAESELWGLDNCIITPHAAGASPKRHHRTVGFFCENLKRYMAGEALQNEIDKNVGFPDADRRAEDIRKVDTDT